MSSIMKEDWIECELGEVCDINMGQSPPSSTYNTEGIGLPFFQGKAEFTDLYPVVRKWCSEPTKLANEGDILLSVRAPVGSTNIANQKCAIGRGLAAISYPFSNKIIWYYLKSIEQLLDKQGTGTTFRAVSGDTVRRQVFPLAPLPIQRAIVSKIEALFSDLDNGIANFKKAQEQLKVYRQAVLKKAFEGKLSELGKEGLKDDRMMDDANEEILQSNNPKNHNSDNKEDNLPKGWKWVKLGDVIIKIEAGKSFRCEERPPINNEVGVLKVSAVTWEEFSEVESKTIISDDKVNEAYFVKQGDFLFSRANTLELVGRSVIVNKIQKRLMLSDKTLRFQFSTDINPFYILYFLRTQSGRKQIESLSTGNQMSMRNIGQSRIKQIVFPLCSLPEQTQIVQEIESRLSVCDKMEQSINESIEKAEALRQSILKKAFEGKLLSEAEIAQCKQAADYEPAGELLKKIQAEKVKTRLIASQQKKKGGKNGK